jgi:hypothetical protein
MHRREAAGIAVITTLNIVSTKKPEPSADETAARSWVQLARQAGLWAGRTGCLISFTRSFEHDGDKRLAQLEQRWVRTGGLGRCDVRGPRASKSLREARRNMLGTRGRVNSSSSATYTLLTISGAAAAVAAISELVLAGRDCRNLAKGHQSLAPYA